MFLEILQSLFFCTVVLEQYPTIPEVTRSPGSLCTATDPDFKEYRYSEKIPYCQRNVSSSLKRSIYESYGVPEEERGNYTIDHIIPLSIGGSNSLDNLWPEHREVKATRPNLEQQVYDKLRKGEISQDEAVRMIKDAKF